MPKSPFAHYWNLLMNPYGIRPAENVRYSIGIYFPNKSSSKEPMERPPLLPLSTITLYVISCNHGFTDPHDLRIR